MTSYVIRDRFVSETRSHPVTLVVPVTAVHTLLRQHVSENVRRVGPAPNTVHRQSPCPFPRAALTNTFRCHLLHPREQPELRSVIPRLRSFFPSHVGMRFPSVAAARQISQINEAGTPKYLKSAPARQTAVPATCHCSGE